MPLLFKMFSLPNHKEISRMSLNVLLFVSKFYVYALRSIVSSYQLKTNINLENSVRGKTN